MADCFSAEHRLFKSNAALISIFYINDHGACIRWLITVMKGGDSFKMTLP